MGYTGDLLAVSKAYIIFFLYIEPISALVGAFYALVLPRSYLRLTHLASAPAAYEPVPIGTSVVLTQLANLYVLFAVNEALVLRCTTDIRVWKTVLFGLLIADFGHLYSVYQLGHEVYWRFWNWNAMAWGNVAFVYLGAAMRLAFLCGFGVGSDYQSKQPLRGVVGQARKKT